MLAAVVPGVMLSLALPAARANDREAALPSPPPNLTGVVIERAPDPSEAASADESASRVLLLSGDGGWTDVEESLSAEFVDYGLTVIGVDSRRTFVSDHAREEIAHYLEHLTGSGQGLIIVGYAFGADLLPIVWPALSRNLRDSTVRVAMISPTHDGSLRIDPTGRYDAAFGPTIPLQQTVQHVPRSRLVCIFGMQERLSGYSSCTNPQFDPAERVELPGGHDLGRNYADVAGAIAKPLRLKRHRTAGGPPRHLPPPAARSVPTARSTPPTPLRARAPAHPVPRSVSS
ncbi:AcvB/VirJ family lysyl-phosphatidylglycerol hydrolase [Nostoc sp. NIES-2111]